MENSYRRFLAALVPAAALTFTGFSAQAQNYYTTNFSDPDTGSSATGYTPAAYSSPAADPTDPIVGQNGWVSNDGTATATNGGAQLVGNSNFVGPIGVPFGGSYVGVLGGVYRTASPSPGTPDVVPSATNAPSGIISLSHPVSLTPAAATFAVDFDLYITAPGDSTGGAFSNHDTFSFRLGTGTTTVASINFVPAAANAATNDTITLTGPTGQTNATGFGVVLNSQYHLSLLVSNTTTGAFTLSLQGQIGAAQTVATGVLGPINAATVTQTGVLWNLIDKTNTNGAFQGAGDNYIAVDNLVLGVPEPSTYAALAVGAAGLAWTLRRRRQQA